MKYLKILIISFFLLFAGTSNAFASWFDGLSEEALLWLYEEVNRTGDRPNIQVMTFGDIRITIQFTEGTEGSYVQEDQGWWGPPQGESNEPVWVENWVEVWHKGTPSYYFVKITDLNKETLEHLLYVSDEWKRYGTKDDIIKEIKAAFSDEDATRAGRFLTYLKVMALRRSVFSTGVGGEKKAPLISSETPLASADRTGLRIINHLMSLKLRFKAMPPIKSNTEKEETEESEKTKDEEDQFKTEDFIEKTTRFQTGQKEQNKDKMKIISGMITYEKFDFWGMSGKTYEVLTEIEQNLDNFTWGFLIPAAQVDLNWTKWEKLGVTGYVKKEFVKDNFDFSLGFTIAGEQTWIDYEEFEDSLAYGCGPLGSLNFYIFDILVSFGVNYLYMDNSEYDKVDLLTTALNIGIPIKQHIIMNLFTYRTDNLGSDNDYWSLGGTFAYGVSDAFHLVLGYNTIQDLDNYDSDTFHLGGSWKY